MKRIFYVCFAVVLMFCLFSCAQKKNNTFTVKTVEAGYQELPVKPELQKVINLKSTMNIADDEFVVFYYRPDGDYEPWALWV